MMFKNLNIRSRGVAVWLILFIPITFINCSSGDATQPAVEKFPVINPIIKDTSYTNEYVADIHSLQNTEIRAKAGGYLESIHVDEGAFVKSGQLLFTISRQQYQQELLKAEAMLASAIAEMKAAEVELKNTRALVEKNIISSSELEVAEAKVEALKAKAEEARAHETSAQLQLSYAQIKAPFSGYINRIPNKAGSLIEEGTLLTTISNNEEMLAYFNLAENDYLDLISANHKPKEVSLRLSNNAIYPYAGKVETSESEIDKSTGSIAFRARFINPENILKHGSSGKIIVSKELKEAMLVPQKSTFEIQENLYVFTLDSNDKVAMRRIIPARYISHYYIIESGLEKDDRFILEGVQLVKQGDTILPEFVSNATTHSN